MPKKTKRQKLLAEKHRQKILTGFRNSSLMTSDSQPVKNQIHLPEVDSKTNGILKYTFNKQSVTAIKSVQSQSDYSYVNKDLKRISLFTFIAISLQVVIYFVLKGS